MNRNQKIVVWCGIIFLFLMTLFPPWCFTDYGGNPEYGLIFIDKYNEVVTDSVYSKWLEDGDGGYYSRTYRQSARIYYKLLLIQYFITIIICGGLVLIFKK